MSFHEKSAWACFWGIAVVFGGYFWLVWQAPLAFVFLLAGAVLVLTAVLVAFHVVNALATRTIRQTGDTPPLDERDRLIELRAAKFSAGVLAAVVVIWSCTALLLLPAISLEQLAVAQAAAEFPSAGANPQSLSLPLLPVLNGIQLLFAGFVLANLAYYGGIVAGYRGLRHG
ncbi:MAG: hypothetical protein SFX18_15895 [Pirellulales bacterium]|nr:hypothetical protein [Pirellulales bacterium]